jgi:hypothetical protein
MRNRFRSATALADVAHILKKIDGFEPRPLRISGVFVVDGLDSACSEDLAS